MSRQSFTCLLVLGVLWVAMKRPSRPCAVLKNFMPARWKPKSTLCETLAWLAHDSCRGKRLDLDFTVWRS